MIHNIKIFVVGTSVGGVWLVRRDEARPGRGERRGIRSRLAGHSPRWYGTWGEPVSPSGLWQCASWLLELLTTPPLWGRAEREREAKYITVEPLNKEHLGDIKSAHHLDNGGIIAVH